MRSLFVYMSIVHNEMKTNFEWMPFSQQQQQYAAAWTAWQQAQQQQQQVFGILQSNNLWPILSAATAAASAINTTSRKFWVRFKGLSRGGALKPKFSDSVTHSASTALCVSLFSQDFSSTPDTWLNPFTWHDSNFSCHGSHGLLLLTSCSDCAAIWFRRAISLSQWSCGISEHIKMESNLLPSTAAVAHLTLFSSTQEGVARNFWLLNQSCAAWPPYLVSVFSAGDYVATYQKIVCFPLWIFLCTS